MRYSVQMLSLCSIVLVLIAGCRQSGGQQSSSQTTPPPSFGDAQSAAQRGLETFRRLVTPANFKELGFDSVDEVSSASLGTPNAVFSVGLEQLKSYQAGGDANQLLADAGRTIYPVMVRDQARAQITVQQNNGKWTASGFGDPKLARQISAATKNVSAQVAPMIVHVLPFNLYFVGLRSDNRLMLTPLGDYSSFNLKAGATQSADEVFTALGPFAKNYNGLPM